MDRPVPLLCSSTIRKVLLLALAFCLLAAGGFAFGAAPIRVPLITLTVPSTRVVQALVDRAHFDVAAVRPTHSGFEVDVVAHPGDHASILTASYPTRVAVPDLLTVAQAVAGDYRDFEHYETEMKRIEIDYPQLARTHNIGLSIEGRTITALEMASPVTAHDGRPEVAFLGLHHAREWPSGEMVMNLAWDLAQQYGASAQVRALLDTTRVWLVPVVNPDGFVYSRTVYPMWRKNRRPNGDAYNSIGVDNNRNYGYQWGGPGSSRRGRSSTYRGLSPFSEPETQSIRNLFLRGHVITAVTNHTYSNVIIFPWGYTRNDTPEEATFKTMAEQMAAFNGYASGQAIEMVGYLASGITDDWGYGVLGGFVFTFEHGDVFHPPYGQVGTMYAMNYSAFLYLAEQAKVQASLLYGTVTDSATGLGVRARLTLARDYPVPVFGGSNIVDTRRTTLESHDDGRYTWHVLPSKMPAAELADGGYTLTVEAPGYLTQTIAVTVQRREQRLLDISLTPGAAAAVNVRVPSLSFSPSR